MEHVWFWLDFFISDIVDMFTTPEYEPTLPVREIRIVAYLVGIVIVQHYARRLCNKVETVPAKTTVLLSSLIIAPVAGFAVWTTVILTFMFIMSPP